MSRRRRVKLQCRVRHVESRPLSRCTLANCRQPSKFATPKLPVQPMRDTRTSSHDGVHTSVRGPRDDCRGEHGLRPCGLISTGAHRASHRPVAPAGSGWCSGPSRAPPRGADHAVPAGAAACSQLCKPHRSQYGCRATQLHQGRVRRLLVQWPPGLLASWPTASCGSAAANAATTCFWPSAASGVAFAPHAARGACPRLPRSSSTTSYRMCRCRSGCCRCRSRCARC